MTPAFRTEIEQLSPADLLILLGWLLDPGRDDPQPDLPDAMLNALEPLHFAYDASYNALRAASGAE